MTVPICAPSPLLTMMETNEVILVPSTLVTHQVWLVLLWKGGSSSLSLCHLSPWCFTQVCFNSCLPSVPSFTPEVSTFPTLFFHLPDPPQLP